MYIYICVYRNIYRKREKGSKRRTVVAVNSLKVSHIRVVLFEEWFLSSTKQVWDQ